MHRSGTSAATRLVNVLGPATCAPDDMVRGPWNPSGHFESRSLMHLNNALLTQMGRRGGTRRPPAAGYDAVAERVTTTTRPGAAGLPPRPPRSPWVWKDPRTSVLLPFWRATLGPRLVVGGRRAATPSRWPGPCESRHGLSVAFGVALWERYNRLILRPQRRHARCS